ncbi:hypothetical protein [Catellatospora tritici]|uniref:hypothetical protein n=1 Tax=Catellatospora tritici TaxID=2851566 RepID=UPI001C2D8E63|nr:hypothetical protein [Catellatospora tritici]MBV1850253.1 hypothetical protein [Catellatospora tritici]
MGWKYQSPPGWPTPPEDWTPPPGWKPDPSWPAPPDDWQFWVSDGADDPTQLMHALLPDDEDTPLDQLWSDGFEETDPNEVPPPAPLVVPTPVAESPGVAEPHGLAEPHGVAEPRRVAEPFPGAEPRPVAESATDAVAESPAPDQARTLAPSTTDAQANGQASPEPDGAAPEPVGARIAASAASAAPSGPEPVARQGEQSVALQGEVVPAARTHAPGHGRHEAAGPGHALSRAFTHAHTPTHARPKRRRRWWMAGAAGVALLLCLGLGVGGVMLARDRAGDSKADPVVESAAPDATEVVASPSPRQSTQAQAAPVPSPQTGQDPPDALPQDQVFEGAGPQVVPLNLNGAYHTALLSYRGTGPFLVQTVNKDGAQLRTLVEAGDSYDGVRPLDLDDKPAAVSIKADGPWKMTVRQLAESPVWNGTANGVGSQVLLVPRVTDDSTKVVFDHRGQGPFTVQAYGAESASLLSQEGDFTGETVLPHGTVVVVIEASGVWTLSRG